MKRRAIIVSILLAFGLVGCGSSSSTGTSVAQPKPKKVDRSVVESLGTDWTSNSDYYIVKIKMDNDKSVVCVEMQNYKKGGISCNWQQFNKDSGR